MKLFIVDAFTKEQFVKSVINWCQNKDYPMADLDSHISELNFSEIYENQMLEITNVDELGVIASRQTTETSKGNWTVDAILNYKDNVLCVYMDYSINENGDIRNIKKRCPHLINMIINDGYAEDNLGFALKTSAIVLDESNKDVLVSAIDSNSNSALPVVYLSSKSKLNADSLALKLSGLAVVINDKSDILYGLDSSRYSEPIYVFVPHKMMEPVSFGDYPMHRDIIRVIADYLNSRNYNKLETWDGINGEALRLKSREILEKLKQQSADNEFNKGYLADLETENAEYSKKYEALTEELHKLKIENERLRYNLESYSSSGTPVIVSGEEKDFYPNEQTEIIMEILKDYLDKSLKEDCRRADILRSLIDANHVDGIPEKYRKIIKNALQIQDTAI